MNQDRLLIDKIVYLAGLASAKDVIDAKLDVLRGITSQLQPGAELDESSRARLMSLEGDLRQYLITQDPLRNFTADSLEQRVQSYIKPVAKPKRVNFFVLALLSFLPPLVVFVIPPYSILFAVSIYFTAISLEIVLVYRSALHNFKPELRQVIAYQYAAAIALALAFFVYVLLEAFSWYNLPLFSYGGLPYAGSICLILLYLSMRKYAKLVGQNTTFMSVIILSSVLTAVALTGTFVPLITAVDHELFFRMSFTGMLILGVFAAFAAGIAKTILKVVTPAYSKSLKVTFWFLLLVSICGPLFGIYLYATGELVATQLSYAMIPLAGPPMLILLYAAYSFKKETSQ